jgi:cysteine-rich repeat protein
VLGGQPGTIAISFSGTGVATFTCVVSATPAICGDGIVAGAEQCDDGNLVNGDGCDSQCHVEVPVVPAGCGDGVRSATEQCDDGNNLNLDGCDSTCHFEQVLRANSLTIQFGTDAVCTANAFGGAFTPFTQGTLQSGLDQSIQDGSTSVLFQMIGLDDLTGANDGMMSVGVMRGLPVSVSGYNGTADTDFWYTIDPLSIDAARRPIAALSGAIALGQLSAGPGSASLPLAVFGSLASLQMSSLRLSAAIGGTSTPLASAGTSSPGHLAAEHLNSALVSFASVTLGTACGDISAASLAQIPIPAALAVGGATACTQGYTTSNTVLDLLVGGCTNLVIQSVKPTQPDQTVPTAPQPGAGGLYKLSMNASHHVDACRDSGNAAVNLTQCLNAAAYSSYFDFTADRVIAK